MIDWSKPLLTQDGRHARLIDKNLQGPFSFVVAVMNTTGNESIHTYKANGEHGIGVKLLHLNNVPTVEVVFKNFSDEEICIFVHETLEQAISAVDDEMSTPIGVMQFTLKDDVTTDVKIAHTYGEVDSDW